MSTMPVVPSFQEIPTFVRKNEVILVWPGDSPQVIRSLGEDVVLPPRDQVAKPGAGSVYRFASAVDEGGIPIPGTVLLTDVFGVSEDPNGDAPLALSAEEFSKILWSNRNTNGLFKRGFMIVRTPAEARLALAQGRALWDKAEDEWADQEIRTELSRLDHWRKQGQPAPRSSSADSVERAFKHKESRAQANRSTYSAAQLEAVLTGGPALTVASEAPALAPEKTFTGLVAVPPAKKTYAAQSGDLSPAEMATSLMEQCEKRGIDLSAAELKGLMRGDESVLEAVNEKLDAKEV